MEVIATVKEAIGMVMIGLKETNLLIGDQEVRVDSITEEVDLIGVIIMIGKADLAVAIIEETTHHR